jgi:hypothetical protein
MSHWHEITRRIQDFQRSGQVAAVLGGSVLADAGDLWQAAQPGRPDHPADDDARLTTASHALGWLHFLRYAVAPAGPSSAVELSRTLVYLWPFAADHPNEIPWRTG